MIISFPPRKANNKPLPTAAKGHILVWDVGGTSFSLPFAEGDADCQMMSMCFCCACVCLSCLVIANVKLI